MQENKSNSVPSSSIQPSHLQPPPKSMRISDMYFPDPMFYPGFYPTGMYNPYPYNMYNQPNYSMPNFNNNNLGDMFSQMSQVNRAKNFMNSNNDKYERNRMTRLPENINRSSNRFSAMKTFVDTVHNIHNPVRNNKSSNFSLGGINKF